MVVVAPIGTKPLLGGSRSSVPAATLSAFLMLLSATSAGALNLNLSAIANSDSPGWTTYLRGAVVADANPQFDENQEQAVIFADLDNRGRAIYFDGAWWGENLDQVTKQYTAWQIG